MEKLQFFRIKELKDVLTRLGLSKQGKKQDLVDRIQAIVSEDHAATSKTWPKKYRKEEVVRLVDDTYRKMQTSCATDVASSSQAASGSTPVKPKEEIDDSSQVEMKIHCLCGSSLLTESMIRCEDPKCQTWQHIRCVIIREKPTEGIPPVPPQFYCELCRLNRADPFLLTVAHLLYPVKLMITSMPSDGENPVQGVEKTFQITRTDRTTLSKPEYDVQAWCMLLNDKVSFRMQWPQYAELQVNGAVVRAINRPGSQLLGASGRDDGPIITPYTRDGINKISLKGSDARLFCLGVRIVKRRTLPQILNLIPKESDGERFEDALARVRRCLSGGNVTENADSDSDSDLEVVADSLTVNLRCPMSGSRIKIAGRFRPCAHTGCFDLNPYVEMQQRSRKWQCPICLKNYSLEHIIIDPYFNRITSMMRVCGEDTTDIELKPDGSWRVKGDNENKDLKQWHFSDGSLIHPWDEHKPKPETSKVVKREGAGLKIGIKRNSNGCWEVKNKVHKYNVSSSERFQEHNIFPMSSSDTGSGKECKDEDANGSFDFSVNNGVEVDSVGLNPDLVYGFSSQGAGIIVLSDSDEDNGNIQNGYVDAGGVDLDHAFQEDPALGGGLDLSNSNADDFGMPLWQLPPTTQLGSRFQLFSPDVAPVSNPINCPMSMSDYSLLTEAPINSPTRYFPDSYDGHPNNNDLINDGLVDNPLAFGGEDPSLQIFLPTRPSDSVGHTGLQHQQNASNGNQGEDWISLRLGDGGSDYHGESSLQNGLNSGHLMQSKDGAPQSLPETASLHLNGISLDRTRQKSDSPSSVPPQQRHW